MVVLLLFVWHMCVWSRAGNNLFLLDRTCVRFLSDLLGHSSRVIRFWFCMHVKLSTLHLLQMLCGQVVRQNPSATGCSTIPFGQCQISGCYLQPCDRSCYEGIGKVLSYLVICNMSVINSREVSRTSDHLIRSCLWILGAAFSDHVCLPVMVSVCPWCAFWFGSDFRTMTFSNQYYDKDRSLTEHYFTKSFNAKPDNLYSFCQILRTSRACCGM